MGEEKRHEMMQNLFGDQSEEDEEIDSEHESNPHPNYASDEAEGAMEPEGEGEGEAEVEGHGEAEVESDGDLRDLEPDPGESEGERVQSSQEVDIGDQREESEAKETDSDEKEDYGQRVVTSRRREVIESGSERSEENHYPDNEDEEVDQTRSLRSPMEEEGSYGKSPRLEDMVHDEDARYESDDEHVEVKQKEKPVGPPLELEVPFRPAPAHPTKMNMIKVSNIMGIDPKPFDPKTYVEEDTFVTDESGSKKRIRLENNIVRWRTVRKKDGTTSYESNARFVRWSDGSLQLLIGNEVLDISVQEAQHDQSHLFLRHGKVTISSYLMWFCEGILQSQGRILSKMRFMPSSLSSNSHRLLTALVDSHHKKVYKVKNCITDVDPEREKEEKEKAENQTIRANVLLNRKREKVNRKYTQTVERKRQLSTGYLEGALDEDDEMDYNDSRRSRRRFEEDLEVEARAEKRIMNAKKSQGYRDVPRKSSVTDVKSSRRPISFSESDREESEYETEGEEDERSAHNRIEDEEPEYEESEEEEEEERYEEADANANRASEEEEEAEEPRQKVKESVGSSKRKGIESDEDSPPRKAPTHRRMAVVYDSDEE
ncbi:hypothetical protein Goshw_026569 [Gossypium schwendimanii]|uniref:Leo1-like protein n=1 Tax=Gossypium schwendimanii TaxID=34291 RepID=A0A7J9LYB9_GOSSC|nr:hypothetical protein [Gossypium schwendimanii]